jgi:hypothetical protein
LNRSRSAVFLIFGRGVRQLLDEHDVVRQPPFGHLAGEELDQPGLVDRSPRPAHGDQQRSLAPLRVAHGNDRRFR